MVIDRKKYLTNPNEKHRNYIHRNEKSESPHKILTGQEFKSLITKYKGLLLLDHKKIKINE